MIVYFNNDGSYGQNAINIPVMVNDKPIGFVSEVTEERVVCYLWDRYINVGMNLINFTKKEQDIRSISIVTTF